MMARHGGEVVVVVVLSSNESEDKMNVLMFWFEMLRDDSRSPLD
jgi:hypothetical protein